MCTETAIGRCDHSSFSLAFKRFLFYLHFNVSASGQDPQSSLCAKMLFSVQPKLIWDFSSLSKSNQVGFFFVVVIIPPLHHSRAMFSVRTHWKNRKKFVQKKICNFGGCKDIKSKEVPRGVQVMLRGWITHTNRTFSQETALWVPVKQKSTNLVRNQTKCFS